MLALNFRNCIDEEIRTSLFCTNLINTGINRVLLIISHKGLVSLRIRLTVMVYMLSMVI